MPLPIVLAHGIARFDAIFAKFGFDLYFKHVPEHLAAHGFTAYRSRVDYASSVVKRSGELKEEVERILREAGADKAHIIAHSMGGLDARHMIVDLGMADRVASLTTIGTPHHGTSFADVGLKGGDVFINLVGRLGIALDGFRDLATTACREFNERAEDSEASNPVRYQVYSSFEEKAAVLAPLQHSWQIIHDREGANDGLVPVSSQEWVATLSNKAGLTKAITQRQFGFGADHLNQTGVWDVSELAAFNFDVAGYERKVRDVYLAIARDVATPAGGL
jgi:triacylglycerol lipase